MRTHSLRVRDRWLMLRASNLVIGHPPHRARMKLALGVALLIGCGTSHPGGAGDDVVDPSGGDGGPTVDPDSSTTPDAPPAGTQHLEIYSGDGMVVMGGWPSGDLMKVMVLDAANHPAPGVAVTWAVTESGIAITSPAGEFLTGQTGVSTSDASGLARAGLRGEFLSQTVSGVHATLHVSIPTDSLDFHAYSTYWQQQIPALPAMYITTPGGRDLGTFAPNETRVGALVAEIYYQAGNEQNHGVVGTGVRLVSSTDAGTDAPPIMSCANATIGKRAGGTVYADAAGHATCDVHAPSTPGNYTIGVRVGGATDFTPFQLKVQ